MRREHAERERFAARHAKDMEAMEALLYAEVEAMHAGREAGGEAVLRELTAQCERAVGEFRGEAERADRSREAQGGGVAS